MILRRVGCLVVGGVAAWAGSAGADEFALLDGPFLARALGGPDATARASLTFRDLGEMPPSLRDSRSALVLVRTDLGNPARMLVAAELRQPVGRRGEPIPVLVLERLDAFDAAEPSTRLASRRDVMVFDRFQVDLDTGQVVPEGQGGDVTFRVDGEAGPRLEPVGGARLCTLAGPPALDAPKVPRPTPGKAVVDRDFAGRYRLFADGQWSGTLDLAVQGRGVVRGKFRSDLHGTTYEVSGQVAADAPQKVLFAIQYPRARQEFEGYLWAGGKGAIAGLARLDERPVGFFAIREGGTYAPEGADLGPLAPLEADRPGRLVVDLEAAGVRLDGKPTNLEGLGITLRALDGPGTDPAPWVLIRSTGDRSAADLARAIEVVRGAGIASIRLEVAGAIKIKGGG